MIKIQSISNGIGGELSKKDIDKYMDKANFWISRANIPGLQQIAKWKIRLFLKMCCSIYNIACILRL